MKMFRRQNEPLIPITICILVGSYIICVAQELPSVRGEYDPSFAIAAIESTKEIETAMISSS